MHLFIVLRNLYKMPWRISYRSHSNTGASPFSFNTKLINCTCITQHTGPKAWRPIRKTKNYGLVSCKSTRLSQSRLEPTFCWSETQELEYDVLFRSATTSHNMTSASNSKRKTTIYGSDSTWIQVAIPIQRSHRPKIQVVNLNPKRTMVTVVLFTGFQGLRA